MRLWVHEQSKLYNWDMSTVAMEMAMMPMVISLARDSSNCRRCGRVHFFLVDVVRKFFSAS